MLNRPGFPGGCLPYAIDLEILLKHTRDLWHQPGITLHPCRQRRRIGPPGGMGVIGRWGNRQHLADRLDPIRPALIVDERDHGLCRRAWAPRGKNAAALRRVSFARRRPPRSPPPALRR